MRRRLKRSIQNNYFVPNSKTFKQAYTDQGRYTMYAIVICAIIGMAMSRLLQPVIPIINRTIARSSVPDVANLIAFGFSAILLIVLLLNMKSIMKVVVSANERRRLKAFNEKRKTKNESSR